MSDQETLNDDVQVLSAYEKVFYSAQYMILMSQSYLCDIHQSLVDEDHHSAFQEISLLKEQIDLLEKHLVFIDDINDVDFNAIELDTKDFEKEETDNEIHEASDIVDVQDNLEEAKIVSDASK